jgi:hypothetical protein
LASLYIWERRAGLILVLVRYIGVLVLLQILIFLNPT